MAHDLTIIHNINETVSENDDLYILGDLMLNDNEFGMFLIRSIKCNNIHIILGNHDTDTRIELYKTLPNVVEIKDAIRNWKYGKYHFYLSHEPTLTGNLTNKHLSEMTLNLYGHTHQKTNFYEDRPYMYHVGVNSHNNYPVSIDQIIEDMKNKRQECLAML